MFKVQTGHLSNSTGLCLRSNSAVQIGGMGRFDRSVEHSGWEAVVANFALKASEACAVIACTVGHSILAIDDELNLLVIPPSQVSTSPYLVTHASGGRLPESPSIVANLPIPRVASNFM